MIDEKFIVFHRDDIKAGQHEDRYWDVYIPEDAIEDAVVIRKQDAFSSAALFGYAASIAVTIAILKQQGPNLFAEKIKQLQEIADYFNAQAEDALNYDSRLPD